MRGLCAAAVWVMTVSVARESPHPDRLAHLRLNACKTQYKCLVYYRPETLAREASHRSVRLKHNTNTEFIPFHYVDWDALMSSQCRTIRVKHNTAVECMPSCYRDQDALKSPQCV